MQLPALGGKDPNQRLIFRDSSCIRWRHCGKHAMNANSAINFIGFVIRVVSGVPPVIPPRRSRAKASEVALEGVRSVGVNQRNANQQWFCGRTVRDGTGASST